MRLPVCVFARWGGGEAQVPITSRDNPRNCRAEEESEPGEPRGGGWSLPGKVRLGRLRGVGVGGPWQRLEGQETGEGCIPTGRLCVAKPS